MTVRELQENYPDFSIIVSVWDEEHNGDYLLDDNTELADRIVKEITSIDDSFLPIIRCNCQ